MKKHIKSAGIVIFVILLTAIIATGVSAKASLLPNQEVFLTVNLEYAGNALSGVPYQLYKVASLAENEDVILTEEYMNYPVSFSDWEENDDLAYTLAAYTQRDSLAPIDTGKTDDAGELTFPNSGEKLYAGIYLLLATPVAKNGFTYETVPVLLNLPSYDTSDNSFRYNVLIKAKSTRTENSDAIVDYNVIKIWQNDSNQSRPQQIVVQLLCNGSVYDTVELTSENGWQYSWQALPKLGSDGTVIQWSVAEREISGYTVSITSSKEKFLITNTAVAKTLTNQTNSTNTLVKQKKLPQTGLLWWPVPLLILLGVSLIFIGNDRSSKRRK